jgi:predicted peptidase
MPLGAGSGAPNGFYEYLPPGYDGSAPAPLLVFWHGLGEDGNGTSELARVLHWGPPALISKDEWPGSRPFIVLSPQNAADCPDADSVDGFFAWATSHYDVDPKRI